MIPLVAPHRIHRVFSIVSRCDLDGWTTKDLVFLWSRDKPVQVNENLKLPRFTLEQYTIGECNSNTTTGKVDFSIRFFAIWSLIVDIVIVLCSVTFVIDIMNAIFSVSLIFLVRLLLILLELNAYLLLMYFFCHRYLSMIWPVWLMLLQVYILACKWICCSDENFLITW